MNSRDDGVRGAKISQAQAVSVGTHPCSANNHQRRKDRRMKSWILTSNSWAVWSPIEMDDREEMTGNRRIRRDL